MSPAAALAKRPTRIPGLDEMTRGGLPASGVTLLAGGTGSGKTVLALQICALSAQAGEGAVFASFEESPSRLRTSAAAFSWGRAIDDEARVRLVDARPPAARGASGSFGLEGLFATLQALAEELPRPWVVLDGIDQLLAHQPEALDAAAQLLELDAWSERAGVPVIVTGKIGATVSLDEALLGTFEFLVPTSIRLSTASVGQRTARRLRVVKYRGSGHVTDEVPMVMDEDGVHLPYGAFANHGEPGAERERIGTGIPRLDRVLGGGLYRGSAVLLSGAPGTAKTTLSASISEAAARRSERVLYVTFDEGEAGVVRNAASVGMDLGSHIDAGRLRIVSRSAWSALPEEHYLAIHQLLEDERPDVLVIDPVSALLKQENETSGYLSIDRILGVARARNITTVLTSLTTGDGPGEDTRSRASTVADTWISLENRVHRGERNRALSIVKSRGASHSSQVRELVMSEAGVDLVDVYSHGSEVLMGTARVHEEHLREQRAQARTRPARRGSALARGSAQGRPQPPRGRRPRGTALGGRARERAARDGGPETQRRRRAGGRAPAPPAAGRGRRAGPSHAPERRCVPREEHGERRRGGRAMTVPEGTLGPTRERPSRLVLLVAADAPRSRRARGHLATALEAADLGKVTVDEVDVLREPREALKLGVFATPALVWTNGASAQSVLYGDLSDDAALRRFLASYPVE